MSPLWVSYPSVTSRFPPFAFVELVSPYNKKNITRWLEDVNFMFSCSHSCPILSNRFHPTKQHSICCRSENCISLARSGQSVADSIDSFDLSNGKVYCRFDKCGRRSDNCISLETTATRCKIVESIDSFDWWEWLFLSRFHIKGLSNRRIHLNDD